MCSMHSGGVGKKVGANTVVCLGTHSPALGSPWCTGLDLCTLVADGPWVGAHPDSLLCPASALGTFDRTNNYSEIVFTISFLEGHNLNWILGA